MLPQYPTFSPRLYVGDKLLRDLGCLNHLKRNRRSTDSFIQNLSKKLQPQLDVSSVLDEWKLLQADQKVSELLILISGLIIN